MYLLILLLPLLGFIFTIGFGRYIGLGAFILSTGSVGLTLLLTIIAFYEVVYNNSTVYIDIGYWINLTHLQIGWSFIFDSITVSMLFIITLISFLVHFYSIYYMYTDKHYPRFMAYLSLFTFFMILLVTSNNLLLMFFGWEGVGLVSYFLINFWYTRVLANKAALKAFIINKFGDVFLLMGILALTIHFGTADLEVVFSLLDVSPTGPQDPEARLGDGMGSPGGTFTAITMLILIGIMSKSAQFGLHTWLPDAMEGPTPVSALLHAATMVTAGVYLLIRLSPLFSITPTTLTFISVIGALTAFFAASSGLVQNDVKRVIAYSTSSQLGYMVLACGLFYFDLSFFHLINHAFFKALLFLCSGVIIHSFFNQQDVRYMGGFLHFLPFVYSVFLIGSLSLAGFPFLTGFYSKDLILEFAYSKFTFSSYFVFWLALLTVALTSFYSFRLLYVLFYHKPFSLNLTRWARMSEHPANLFGLLPLGILAVFAIFFGYLFKDLFVGLGSSFLPVQKLDIDAEVAPLSWKLLPLVFAIGGGLSAFIVYVGLNLSANPLLPIRHIYMFFSYKWYFDVIYSRLALGTLLISYIFPFKSFDRGLLEWLGAKGLGTSIISYALSWQKFHSGDIFHFAFFFFISVLGIITGYSLFGLGEAAQAFGVANTISQGVLFLLFLIAAAFA